jgi:phage host-nuclease inhibitor protein Gam
MGKKMIKRTVVAIPGSLAEAAEFIGRIGKEQREIDRIQNELNEAVEKLKSKPMSESQVCNENISQLFEGLFIFAESHRNELTEDGKKKTVEVPTGIFGWRMTPPAVSLKNVKQILKELVKRRLKQFIRVKREVSKEAMLKEPELAASVKGVSIGQYEEFMVKPAELEVEITSDVSKLKKVAS